MNRAATEDVRAPVWPAVSQVLHTRAGADAVRRPGADAARRLGGADRAAPRRRQQRHLRRRRTDGHGCDLASRSRPRSCSRCSGRCLSDLDSLQGLDSLSGESYVDKDLRTLLDRSDVKGKFALRYCGLGDLATCRTSLWNAINTALAPIIAAQGPNPNMWRSPVGPHRLRARSHP